MLSVLVVLITLIEQSHRDTLLTIMHCVRKQGCFERSVKASGDAFFLLLNFLAEFLEQNGNPLSKFQICHCIWQSLRASVPKCILESEKFEQNILIVLALSNFHNS